VENAERARRWIACAAAFFRPRSIYAEVCFMPQAEASLDSRADTLVGQRLSHVRYYTLPYGITQTPAFDFDAAHVADYGIDLVTEQATVGVTWTGYGTRGYGLDLRDGPLLTELERGEFHRVERLAPWAELVGQIITGCKVNWLESDTRTGGRDRIPTALTVQFANGVEVAVICGSWRGPTTAILPTGDDLVVVWKAETFHTLAPWLDVGLLEP